MRYDAILIDADDTVFDFRQAEKNAIGEVLEWLGMRDPEAPKVYHACNRACWEDFERGSITQAELKIRRFADFLRHYGRGDDPQKVSDRFVGALSRQSVLLPGALGSVRAIAEKLPVAVVTNGIAKVQHGRMDRSPLKEWISAMIVSEEAGCQKPDPRMIFSALEALGGVAPGRALMVGDSLSSDIRCANNAGVDACWYNPGGLPLPDGLHAEYVLADIRLLPEIALKE